MGTNFHTAWIDKPTPGYTTFQAGSMNPALASLDKAISYVKNPMVGCEGVLSWDADTGTLSWSGQLTITFNREDGDACHNHVAIGNVVLAAGQFAYVTLSETDGAAATVSAGTITTESPSNFLADNILVLVYRSASSGALHSVALDQPFTAAGFEATWGEIGGTIGNQADLMAVLATKADVGSGEEGSPVGTFIASGATVAWVSGLTFRIGAASYYIESVLYASAEAEITLDAADETYDRIDIIALNADGDLNKITGTAAANPALPDLDLSLYCQVTFVYVPADATEPEGATTEDIYTEGSEWTATPTGGTITVGSTNNPRTGTYDIEGTSVIAGNYFTSVRGGGAITIGDYINLVFYIRNKAAWANQKSIRLSWYLGTVLVGSRVSVGNLYGFNRSLIGSYQQVVIPISAFNAPSGATVDRLRWEITGSGAAVGFYVDDLLIQAATQPEAPVVLTEDTGTTLVGVIAGESGTLTLAAAGTGISLSGKTISLLERNANLTIYPEYPGAVMTASGSENDPGTEGMISDSEVVSNVRHNYYEWSSDIATGLQSYDVVVQIPIPFNFIGFQAGASVALTLDIKTEENTTTNNKLDVTINRDGQAATSSLTDQKSSVATTWETIGFDETDTVLAAVQAGETLNVAIRMYSQSSKYTRIGKINLQVKVK